MTTILTDLKENFRRSDIAKQLIYINAGAFIVTTLISTFFQLFNIYAPGWIEFLELPASIGRFIMQPWSIITYMFLHAGLMHILFNMLWLYWFGEMFLYAFTSRQLRGVYFLSGICGGILYILSYNLFPFFQPVKDYSFMLGASASVLGIVTATAYREPNYTIRLFLLGNIRLKYLAMIAVGLDLLYLTSSNAGGHIAHIGGALAGIWFAAKQAKGIDITSGINKIIEGFLSIFDSSRRRPKMKIKRGGGRRQDYDYNAHRKAQSDEIDRILEKLKKSGYESLTTQEKKDLFDASKR